MIQKGASEPNYKPEEGKGLLALRKYFGFSNEHPIVLNNRPKKAILILIFYPFLDKMCVYFILANGFFFSFSFQCFPSLKSLVGHFRDICRCPRKPKVRFYEQQFE
jgi:hypothetical protein